jgi:hypothetical protein
MCCCVWLVLNRMALPVGTTRLCEARVQDVRNLQRCDLDVASGTITVCRVVLQEGS